MASAQSLTALNRLRQLVAIKLNQLGYTSEATTISNVRLSDVTLNQAATYLFDRFVALRKATADMPGVYRRAARIEVREGLASRNIDVAEFMELHLDSDNVRVERACKLLFVTVREAIALARWREAQ